MITYELIPKQVLDDVLVNIENAKVIIAYVEDLAISLPEANKLLEEAYIKIQMNRTGCNVRPQGA